MYGPKRGQRGVSAGEDCRVENYVVERVFFLNPVDVCIFVLGSGNLLARIFSAVGEKELTARYLGLTGPLSVEFGGRSERIGVSERNNVSLVYVSTEGCGRRTNKLMGISPFGAYGIDREWVKDTSTSIHRGIASTYKPLEDKCLPAKFLQYHLLSH